MEIANLINHVEALIFASEKPLTAVEIIELVNNAFGFMDDKVTLDQVETCIDGINEKYNSSFYPFELRQSGGGWQFLTKKEFHTTIAQLNGDKFLKRLSTAALETLAIIAYKQPITKSEIEAIRGVNCDYSIQKLLEKELIIISGRNEQMVGKPLITQHLATSWTISESILQKNCQKSVRCLQIKLCCQHWSMQNILKWKLKFNLTQKRDKPQARRSRPKCQETMAKVKILKGHSF